VTVGRTFVLSAEWLACLTERGNSSGTILVGPHALTAFPKRFEARSDDASLGVFRT